jgi:hypothetical protein
LRYRAVDEPSKEPAVTEMIPSGPPPDTSDMVAIHNVFREALASASTLIGDVPAGDTSRSATVGSYYDNILQLLEVHHEGEDEILTPRLVDRCPDEAALVQRIAAQHQEVPVPLQQAEEALRAWAASADPVMAAEAVATLEALSDVLVPHLGEEEMSILPLAAAYLTAPEWGELPSHGMQHFGGDNVWLILGLIREQMTENQRQLMLAMMPPPVAEAWQNVGEQAFLSFVGELRLG